jgi:hypothetical protein
MFAESEKALSNSLIANLQEPALGIEDAWVNIIFSNGSDIGDEVVASDDLPTEIDLSEIEAQVEILQTIL